MRMLAFIPGDGFLAVWALFLLAVAVAVLPVVALLLIRLIVVTVKLSRNARLAAEAAEDIRANVAAAPHLAHTLQIAGDLLAVVRILEGHGVVLERVLTRHLPPRLVRR
ncbi:MAG: hypothetical protein JWM18_2799 [Chloroflexi bacterium]|jgi:hypothetical protein|nr:hypothetical protein [Chloroflexota bacterium]